MQPCKTLADGFRTAMQLRLDNWATILQGDVEEARTAESDLPELGTKKLTEKAPDLIFLLARTLPIFKD